MSASKYFFRASAADFKKIPSKPIAYWVSERKRRVFSESIPLGEKATIVCGMTTGENALFVRSWFEVELRKCGWGIKNRDECISSHKKWFPYNKGGDYRKWYGNNSHVINWENDGQAVIENGRAFPRSRQFYFRDSITWTFISSSKFGVRISPIGFVFDMSGCSAFPLNSKDKSLIAAFLCTKISFEYLKAMNPTLNFQVGNVSALPWAEGNIKGHEQEIQLVANESLEKSMEDWNSYETSWDFTNLPLLQSEYRQATLKETYQKLRLHWFNMTMKMQQLEEENNRIFIKAYGLQDELTPDVPLKEITLTCNPHYRYGGDKTSVELESLLLADTMKEFVSYAVGCMFGRYSLDKEGLILANQGETLADYLKQVPEPTFMPDDDNVIPVLDGEWFTDDVTERFRRFVKVTFGDEYYQENLAFIEQSIGKDIRKYFLKDFYADHVKRYKKRPIYWMFSSPKGSFNALIYMHRYQPTTASVVLNGYLREFRTKLIARKEHLEQVSISASVSQRDKTSALKEIEKLKKMIDELESWERDVLYPLAAEQIEIDLDDGVKVNYPKFGKALKKVAGLS